MFDIKYNYKTIGTLTNIGLETFIKYTALENNTEYYLVHNGKRLNACKNIEDGIVHVIPKLVGGKGGFGSMLRAIGAQIEKTTNREACRDLSGRRLRDINEEKRLKAWIDNQAVKEQDAEEKKIKKLEKLVQDPKHEFVNESYTKQRSELPERLEDAITQGLKEAAALSSAASTASASKKRKLESVDGPNKKRGNLWIEDGLELSSSDETDDEDSEVEINPREETMITTN